MSEMSEAGPAPTLRMSGGRILYRCGDGEEIPVRLAWARPITGVGREISVLDENRRERCLIADAQSLDAESRAAALGFLEMRYLLPRIERIRRIRSFFSYRYWHVDTDRGPRRFVTRDAAGPIRSPEHRWILRDSLGGRYEIPDIRALDPESRKQLDAAF